MYCKNCGKKIDSNEDYCFECQRDNLIFGAHVQQKSESADNTTAEAVNVPAPVAPAEIKPAGTYKTGFGPALTSTIVSAVSFVLALVAWIFSFIPLGTGVYEDILNCSFDFEAFAETFSTATSVLLIISLIGAIASIILGIRSISHFKFVKNNFGKKCVPTLVLGIVGTVYSGLTIYFDLLTFFMVKITDFI